ncbi:MULTISPECIES: protein-disulfide reductase DsbD family protein [Sphingobium]|jgi:thiol:disulfide interchange protein|uniref:protein-disulfide reductase DsbD family protein n=1 Tax=Sphingobium TaxID=165695 RepID=UPI000C5EE23C|nr:MULTISPECIES: protein-disulfide reductase DsbD domain-containing protein [Sphingobium]MBS47998.1 thiol:disulfide interchange protein [Sphingobium sp.]MCC4255528.1 thioredoxin family protein [Sphingobium lactosutens]MEE2742023.1 protein-disulfide reductase DsbD domain-containing protein [Pseudomonadota bacterium]HCW59677.1 thiol:disulfide interchange protein [Sphingobium sp.]
MRIFQVIVMTLALLALHPVAWAQGAFGGGPAHIAAQLDSESDSPAPGGATTIAFAMTPEPGWHGYWENPGDAGLGMSVEWTLPRGVTVGPLRYPVPETLLISGLMNHVYEGPYAILANLKVAGDVAQGTRLPVVAKAQWLACTDKVCVPESGTLRLDLVAGNGAVAPASRTRFDAWRMHLPRPLGSQARYTVKDGRLRMAIPLPMEAEARDVHLFALTEGLVRYAADQRVTRKDNQMVIDTAAGEGVKDRPVQAVLRTGDHVGFLLTAVPGPVEEPQPEGQAGAILAALGGALLGGLLLNIMPCVFPILGLKAMSLAKAGGDERSVRREALAYAAGVILTCLALGGLLLALRAAGNAVGWAFQLQDPRIILTLLLLVSAIAFNLAGLFELRPFGGGDGLAGKGGTMGAFWTGALVAFVATPCTGPFMAAAMGAALLLPLAAALAIFAGLGLGLALPFLLLAYIPALRSRLPRPGAWMGRFQKLLSVPMFLTALGLAWLLGQQRGVSGMTIGLGAALLLALLLWWLGARQHGGKGGGLIAGIGALALLAGAAIALPTAAPAQAENNATSVAFAVEKLDGLRAAKKPVFLYFTADWCLTCKANEAAAIDRAEVRAAFDKAGVTVMVGDWTSADPAITRFLESKGRSGVPLYLWYAPGKEAVVLPQLLTPATLTALVR